MQGAGELLVQAERLLSHKEWAAAALHVRLAAQQCASRVQAGQLRALCQGVPPAARVSGDWPEALAWVGYRAADEALVQEALALGLTDTGVFRAFLASVRDDWKEVLRLTEHHATDGLLGAVVARYRACALASLGRAGWQGAYAQAAEGAAGRDRGLVLLELGFHLTQAGSDGAARDTYARSIPWLAGDAWALTLAHANLGIACLKLGEVAAAEVALRDALHWAGKPGGAEQRSTVWRALGGLALQRRLPARARHAFTQAQGYALDADERIKALRGLARALRWGGLRDQALAALYRALPDIGTESHAIYADLAALQALTGDEAGAWASLSRAVGEVQADRGRLAVVQAELARRAGEPDPQRFLVNLPPAQAWLLEEAVAFPEVFSWLGVVAPSGLPCAQVRADGPIRLLLDGVEVPLAPHHHAAALLAFLVAHGGASTTERALLALHFPGQTLRLQKQELSRAVRELREVLGWPEALYNSGGLLRLTPELFWEPLLYPAPAQADLFCEGRLDPWVVEWRQTHLSPLNQIT